MVYFFPNKRAAVCAQNLIFLKHFSDVKTPVMSTTKVILR